ncbi:MAG: 5-formyltetrahydrofolate cyclo-ligase [Dokdonella sp.]
MTVDDPRTLLRTQLRARRQALTASERIASAMAVATQLEGIPEFLTDARIAGYWAVDGELSLHVALANLLRREQRYLLPRIVAPRRLRFGEWKPGDAIDNNRYGIPEPAQEDIEWLDAHALDVILLPLLGFDRNGNRLGFGGGFYDATLAGLRLRDAASTPLLVGVGYAAQEVAAIAPQPWDVRLDYIATERELIDCWEQPG